MQNYIWYSLAAICEIAGCFSFWAWLRLEKNGIWIIPGMLSLALFAFLLTRVDLNANAAGRAYATYGGIYIVASLMWLWLAEGMRPDRWDIFGAGVCLIGMAIILFGRRST